MNCTTCGGMRVAVSVESAELAKFKNNSIDFVILDKELLKSAKNIELIVFQDKLENIMISKVPRPFSFVEYQLQNIFPLGRTPFLVCVFSRNKYKSPEDVENLIRDNLYLGPTVFYNQLLVNGGMLINKQKILFGLFNGKF